MASQQFQRFGQRSKTNSDCKGTNFNEISQGGCGRTNNDFHGGCIFRIEMDITSLATMDTGIIAGKEITEPTTLKALSAEMELIYTHKKRLIYRVSRDAASGVTIGEARILHLSAKVLQPRREGALFHMLHMVIMSRHSTPNLETGERSSSHIAWKEARPWSLDMDSRKCDSEWASKEHRMMLMTATLQEKPDHTRSSV